MKKCRECKSEIPSDAKRCSHCNAKQGNWFARHPIITGIIGLFIVGIMISAVSGSSSKTSDTTKGSSNAAQSEKQTLTSSPTTSANNQASVPAEYKSALNKATSYANIMHMSKKGVYDQLVSEYGEKFSADAAQYAVDNVKADWNANALAKAKTYQSTMSMSPAAIHDQLTADAGEKFTQAEADYAIEHLSK